ncbi:hypothetical protein D9M71_777030 [compost metagenome]
MDNCPQAVGMGFQFADEGKDSGLAGEVREQRRRSQVAQDLHAGAFSAVADDHLMTVFEQSLRTMQANTLAGTGNEDRGCGRGHERLASR